MFPFADDVETGVLMSRTENKELKKHRKQGIPGLGLFGQRRWLPDFLCLFALWKHIERRVGLFNRCCKPIEKVANMKAARALVANKLYKLQKRY